MTRWKEHSMARLTEIVMGHEARLDDIENALVAETDPLGGSNIQSYVNIVARKILAGKLP